MKLAIIGIHQVISGLSGKLKEQDFFKLFGTYLTDTRTLKVSQSAVISPFGLINHADAVIFYKTDEASFNLMIEAVKNSRQILILNPHSLTVEETNELIKVSAEADVEMLVWSKYKCMPVCLRLAEEQPETRRILIEKHVVFSRDADMKETIHHDLAYLVDLAMGLIHANLKKIVPNITVAGDREIVDLHLDFDNGSVAIIHAGSVTDATSCTAELVTAGAVYEISPDKNTFVKKTFGKSIHAETKTVKGIDNDLAVLRQFANALTSEPHGLTTLQDFFKTQVVIRALLDKREMMK